MHQSKKLEETSKITKSSAKIVDSRNCSKLDCATIDKSIGTLLADYRAMTRDERQRLAERTAAKVKSVLQDCLGGSWNVILGRELQVSVGLTPQCRLFRMSCDKERLFCFETYTKISIDSHTSTAIN